MHQKPPHQHRKVAPREVDAPFELLAKLDSMLDSVEGSPLLNEILKHQSDEAIFLSNWGKSAGSTDYAAINSVVSYRGQPMTPALCAADLECWGIVNALVSHEDSDPSMPIGSETQGTRLLRLHYMSDRHGLDISALLAVRHGRSSDSFLNSSTTYASQPCIALYMPATELDFDTFSAFLTHPDLDLRFWDQGAQIMIDLMGRVTFLARTDQALMGVKILPSTPGANPAPYLPMWCAGSDHPIAKDIRTILSKHEYAVILRMICALARAGVGLQSTIPSFSGTCTVEDVVREHPQMPDTLVAMAFKSRLVRDDVTRRITAITALEEEAGALVDPGF